MGELEKETDRLLSFMRNELKKTTHGDAPGKPEWRDEISKDLCEIYRIVADQAVEFGIGIPYDYFAAETYKIVRAMLVVYGSGSKVGNKPIHAQPNNEVWDSDLMAKQKSSAKTSYLLPEEFNQEGNNFVENAIRLLYVYFRVALERVFAGISDAELSACVQVVKRS